MDEKYLQDLYSWIKSKDASYESAYSFDDFKLKMKQDKSYVQKMYKWINTVDPTSSFVKQKSVELFANEVGQGLPAENVGEIKKKEPTQPFVKIPTQRPVTGLFGGGGLSESPTAYSKNYVGFEPEMLTQKPLTQMGEMTQKPKENKLGFLKSSLDMINEDLINSTEEYVVPQLNYHFSDLGFKFEKSGATGDWVTVTAPNGKKKEVGLDPLMGIGASKKVEQLKSFIEQNAAAIPEPTLERLKNMYVGENKKFQSRDQVEFDVKQFNQVAEETKGKIQTFIKNKTALEAEEKYLNSVPISERKTPEYLERLKSAQSTKDFLKSSADDIIQKNAEIKKNESILHSAMGKYTTMAAQQGTFWSGVGNAFLDGAASITAGVTGSFIDVFWEAIPTSGLLRDPSLQPEIVKVALDKGVEGPKQGQDFNEWFKTLPKNVAQDAIDKAQDIGKKTWKYGSKEYGEGMLSAVRRGNRIVYGDPSTTVEWSDATEQGFWGGAILGVAKSLPAMIGGSGWAGAAQRTAQFYTQIADGLTKEMENDPNFKDVTENEKQLILGSVGVAGAVLEEFGLRNVISSKGLLNGVVMRALGKSSVSTTAKTFGEFIRQDVESMVARGALKVVGGTLAEAETGALQQASEFGIKDLYSVIKNKKDDNGDYMKMFNTPNSIGEWAKDVAIAGAQEAVGGFLLSMPSAVSAAYTKKGFKGMDDKLFSAFEAMANDEKLQSAFIVNLKNKITSGEITTQEAKETLNNYRNSVGLFRSLPEGLNIQDKKEAMNLLNEKKAIEQRIQGKDDSLVKPQKTRIEQINLELNKLSENAIQEQTTNESLLGNEEIELGLQEMGTGDTKLEGVAGEKAITEAKPKETVDVDLTLPENKDNIIVSESQDGFVLIDADTKLPIEVFNENAGEESNGAPKSYATQEEAQTRVEELKIQPETVSLKTPVSEGEVIETQQTAVLGEPSQRKGGMSFPINSEGKEVGNVVVTNKDNKGYKVAVVSIVGSDQGRGLGTKAYIELNEKSIKETGQPLSSGLSMNDKSIKLWESLVKSGKAVKIKEGEYQFKESEKTPKIENNGEVQPQRTGDGTGRTEGGKIAPLKGAPSVQGANGPDPQLVAVAEQYAADNGIDLKRQSEYVEVDEERAKRIANAYDEMPHDPQNPKVKEAYQNLIKQTIAQYKALVNAGYKFWFLDLNNPDNVEYASSPYNAVRDMRNNKQMGVFPTTDGFGTTDLDVNDNPLLEETGIMWPVGGLNGQMKPVLANDLFRAVHDAFGHGLEGAGFRARGEENAWQAHVRLFTGSAIGAITSETRGQNSWVNFGPNGESNRSAKAEDTVFADQKTGLMPEWTWQEGRAADMSEEQAPPNETEKLLTDTNLGKVYDTLSAAEKAIDNFLKGGPNSVTTAIPLVTMKLIVKSLKALVKGGMMLQDAITKVASDYNIKESDVISSLTIIYNAERSISEGLSEAELPGFDRMMEEVDGVIERSERRGANKARVKDNVMSYVMGSRVYENATDVQREKLVRSVNKMFEVREKPAPSVGRILGAIQNLKIISMSERDLLKKQLKDYERGAKNVKTAWMKATSDLTIALKDMANSGKVTVKQVANILRKFSKVNMLNEDSIDNFVEYMANVFEDAEYAEKLNEANRLLPNARRNIGTKLGAAMNLIPAMQRLFSINPELIPMPVLNSYLLLVDMMGKRQEVLELKDIEAVTMMTNGILDMVEEEVSLSQELSDRFDNYQDKILDNNGNIKYAETVAAMLKDGVIDEREAGIMRKYKSSIMPREASAEMTEDEIQEEKDKLIDGVLDMSIDSSRMASADDKNKANKLEELIKPENLKHLTINQLKNLIKTIDNINNGYLPHSAQLAIEKLNAVANGSTLAEAIIDGKPLPISKLKGRLKALFTQKDPIQEMVRRGPLYFIDQLFGDFKTKRIFDSVLSAAAKGQALFESNMNKINKRLEHVHSKVAASFGNKSNEVLMSSYKMMTYMIQQEFLSNPESTQVNPAHRFLEETIKFLEKNNRIKEVEMLQFILDNYTTDGSIDNDELQRSFNSAEINALKEIREINDSLTEKAIHTAGVIRGSKISPLNNYIHLPVLSDYDPDSSTSATAAADQYNRNLMPSTKGKSLIERTGKVSPLNFDIFASVYQGAKSVNMDYHLTEPIRTARKTLNEAERMLEERGKLPREKRQMFNAIKKGFNEATENILVNNYVASSFGDDVVTFLTKQGYRAILASVPRFVGELTSNVGFALVSDRKSFAAGIKYRDIMNTSKAVDIVSNVMSKQINRLFHGDPLSGRFIDRSILSEKTGMKGAKPKSMVSNLASAIYNNTLKKYKNVVEFTADTLISTPDKMVMRPIWFGSFANKFKQLTGEEVDFDMIAENNEDYMKTYNQQIKEATDFADNKSVLAGATDNAYMGILKGTAKPNQTAFLKAFNNFNNFMTRFAIYEYTTARTGIYAMVGKGEISKKQGVALMAAVTTRMVVYVMVTQSLSAAMMSAFSGVGDDDEDEKSFMQKLGQSVTSAATGLVFGRDFGNAARSIVNYGLEEANEKFLTGLRNGEYDAYKDAISYSIVPKEKKGQKTTLGDYVAKLGGSLGPALKTVDLIVTKASEEPKKEQGAIERQQGEIYSRIPLEVLGNLGFVPLYKDVRKIAMADIYKSLKEEKKASKEKKEKKEVSESIKDRSDIELLMEIRNEETDPEVKQMIERKINETVNESDQDKLDRKEKNKEEKELKEKLLEGYDNITEMKRYDPDKWKKNFGEGSDWYNSHKIENEIEKVLEKKRREVEDEMHDYVPKTKGGLFDKGSSKGGLFKKSSSGKGLFGTSSKSESKRSEYETTTKKTSSSSFYKRE